MDFFAVDDEAGLAKMGDFTKPHLGQAWAGDSRGKKIPQFRHLTFMGDMHASLIIGWRVPTGIGILATWNKLSSIC